MISEREIIEALSTYNTQLEGIFQYIKESKEINKELTATLTDIKSFLSAQKVWNKKTDAEISELRGHTESLKTATNLFTGKYKGAWWVLTLILLLANLILSINQYL